MAAAPPIQTERAVDLVEVMRAFAPKEEKTETKDGWVKLFQKTSPSPQLRLLRSVFKADTPYRCRLGRSINVATSASGVLNYQQAVSDIANTSEWTSIDALFDEFFVHSMTVHFQPYNRHSSAGAGAINTTVNAAQVTSTAGSTVTSSGVYLVSLFNGATYYTSAAAMLANPTRALKMSDETWSYAWKNNTRFDPRGPALSSASAESWQGWTLISATSNYGGTVQMRTATDITYGDAVHAWNLGSIALIFDVSFRARA